MSDPTNDIAALNLALENLRQPEHWRSILTALVAERDAAIKERDEAVELYTDLLRRLSVSTPPRHAFLSGDASEKEGGGA